MSYYHPEMRGALLMHHEAARHRLVSDPVDVAPGASVPALSYHGGPTIKSPKVIALYVGTFWGDKANNNQFLKDMVEYGYLSGLSGQGSGVGTFIGAFDIPAVSGTVTDADCQSIINGVIGKNGIPTPDDSTIYMLILPDGVTSEFTANGNDASCKTYCAYHSNTATYKYTVQPANTCSGCNQGNAQDGLQMTEAHEIAEACSDPTGQGWYNDSSGEENADECAWVAEQYGPWIVQGYAAQNAAGAWVNTVGAYNPPSTPQPGPKINTGAVLSVTPNPVQLGTSVSLHVAVTSADGSALSGAVQFGADGATIGSAQAPDASLTWTPQTAGTVAVDASYAGDAGHNGSTTAAVNLAVQGVPKPPPFQTYLDQFKQGVDFDDTLFPTNPSAAINYFEQLIANAQLWVAYLKQGGQ